jgi:hypothetical protein
VHVQRKESELHSFRFDGVLTERSDQSAVWAATGMERLVDSVIAGYNATVFAYGQQRRTRSTEASLSQRRLLRTADARSLRSALHWFAVFGDRANGVGKNSYNGWRGVSQR